MPENYDQKSGFWPKLNAQPWEGLVAESWGGYTPPITTHLPVHPALSHDFLHVGPAFQVVRQQIIPGLSVSDLEALERVKHEQTMLIQFAFGDPPFVPDFRRTQVALQEGRWPLPTLEYYSHEGLLYRFEYFSNTLPTERAQTILWIRGSVQNDKHRTLGAHVRMKLSFPQEDDVLDYHYQPYYWDASKMHPSPEVSLAGDEIRFEKHCIGKVLSQDFKFEWETSRQFKEEDYGRSRVEFSPPHPSLRYTGVEDAVHLHRVLLPGEQAEFALAFLVNYEDATEEHRGALRKAEWPRDRATAQTHFQSLKTSQNTDLNCAALNWSDVFAHLPINTLQMLVRHPDVPGWMPTQGGSSERHFVWVGEALHELGTLLKLGYFEPVRQGLEFIFSFQDSGLKPAGRLVSTEGAIGTSGPKWLNSTGAALSLAADYYLYSHDEEFLDEYLPRMLRGVDWVLNELHATRSLKPDGSRAPWHGLMPFGCANDGDYGYFISFTDAYTYAGLAKIVSVLERNQHERAAAIRVELEQYHQDIRQAVANVTRPDGFIDRKITTGDLEEEIYTPFDKTCGAFHLFSLGILDTGSKLCDEYVACMEHEQGNDLFMGRMDRDTSYMGWPEWAWQEIYLRRGEWKKAFALTQINMKYGKSGNAHQVQERFRMSDPTFCPWQPNGSGNGRLLDMMIKSFLYECQGTVTVLAGIPFLWLRQNQKTSLKNLHTPEGTLTLYADIIDDDSCALRLTFGRSAAKPVAVCIPGHFTVEQTRGGERIEANLYSVSHNATSFECVLRDASRPGLTREKNTNS